MLVFVTKIYFTFHVSREIRRLTFQSCCPTLQILHLPSSKSCWGCIYTEQSQILVSPENRSLNTGEKAVKAWKASITVSTKYMFYVLCNFGVMIGWVLSTKYSKWIRGNNLAFMIFGCMYYAGIMGVNLIREINWKLAVHFCKWYAPSPTTPHLPRFPLPTMPLCHCSGQSQFAEWTSHWSITNETQLSMESWKNLTFPNCHAHKAWFWGNHLQKPTH